MQKRSEADPFLVLAKPAQRALSEHGGNDTPDVSDLPGRRTVAVARNRTVLDTETETVARGAGINLSHITSTATHRLTG